MQGVKNYTDYDVTVRDEGAISNGEGGQKIERNLGSQRWCPATKAQAFFRFTKKRLRLRCQKERVTITLFAFPRHEQTSKLDELPKCTETRG